jgi:fungalysin/thermolysin propeptide
MATPNRRSPRASLPIVLALATGLAAVSCMPLPPEGGGIDVGTTSDQWTARIDPDLGSPTSLVNRSLQNETGAGAAAAATDAEAEASVLKVFHSRPEWFRMRSGIDGFRVVRSETRGWLKFLRLEQTYKGVSVAGAGYEAHVLPNGRVGSLEGRYYPDLNLDVRPTFGESQAEDRARASYSPGAIATTSDPSVQFETENGFRAAHVLAVVPQGRKFTLAWGIVVAVGSRDHARVYVDAREGTVIARQMVGWSDTR